MADRRAFLKSIAAAVAVGSARPSFHLSQAQPAAAGIRKSTLISMLPRVIPCPAFSSARRVAGERIGFRLALPTTLCEIAPNTLLPSALELNSKSVSL